MNSSHTSKIDAQLNTAMQVITGTLRSTPTEWLPVLSNIAPPVLRRKLSTKKVPGMDQPRWAWVKLNRLRTGNARCNSMLFKWNAVEDPHCQCGRAEETVQHLVEECHLTRFQSGFTQIYELSTKAKTWLSTIKTL